jgi:hypothetical protein
MMNLKNQNRRRFFSMAALILAFTQFVNALNPKASYTLALTKSSEPAFKSDYEINTFVTDSKGHYAGQSTGLVKKLNNDSQEQPYHRLILMENSSKPVVLTNKN